MAWHLLLSNVMTVPEARTAQPLQLDPALTRRALAARALREAHAHFLFNASALTRAKSPELVHQARVGLRRLRVFVRLFRAQLGDERAVRLGAELRWLFSKLGGVRDLHVVGSDVLPRLDVPPRGRESLENRLRREAETRLAELQTALRSTRFHALCRELAGLEAELAAREAKPKRARKWLARRLECRYDRVVRAGKELGRGDTAALHELRKQVKKLRYASELAPGMFAAKPKRQRAYQHALKELQSGLGELNDLAVARTLVTTLAGAEARSVLRKRIDRLHAAQLAGLPQSLERVERVKPSWR
jgi:triphosphatase